MPSPSNEDRICAMFDSFNKTVSWNFIRNSDRAKHFAEEPADYILGVKDEQALSFPGLEIYPNCWEINLTGKEYDLRCLLVVNKGQVLTYDQIYRKVWMGRLMGAKAMP